MTDPQKYLENLVEELENKDYSEDPHHLALVMDLLRLLQDAVDYKFHDFHKNSYATPKLMLNDRLFEINNKMINGEYDN